MRVILALLASLTALLPSGASYSQTPPVAAPADQAAAIRRLHSSTFEKPESRLSLDPIVVEGNAALVGWIQGNLAGGAYLRDRDGHWVIVANITGIEFTPPSRILGFGLILLVLLVGLIERTSEHGYGR